MSETAVLERPAGSVAEAELFAALEKELAPLSDENTAVPLLFPPDALPEHLSNEEYQRSLECYRRLGALALAEGSEAQATLAAKEELRRMWVTSLAELIENSEQLRGFFEINDTYEYDILNGQVQAQGRPIVDLVRDGARKSQAEAAFDDRMQTQATRDEADVQNAERVDQIAAGETPHNARFVISKSPRAAIAADPDFWRQKNYREGLAFGQLYYAEGSKLLAGTFSIDNVDDEIFDRVLAEHGVQIPAGRTGDQAVLDGVERRFENREQALQFVRSFRARCYELQGDTRHRQSVNEFLAAHTERTQAVFETLCVPLAASTESGVMVPILRDFAQGLLNAAQRFKPEARQQLVAICNKEECTDEQIRFLAGLTLYAAAEELYEDAYALAHQTAAPAAAHQPNLAAAETADAIVHQLTSRVLAGVEAGRTHGGACAGTIDLAADGKNDAEGRENPQSAYGGRGKAENVKLPNRIRCIKCRKESPKEKVVHADCWSCPHCRYKIDICTGKELHPSELKSDNREREDQVFRLLGELVRKTAVSPTEATLN